MSALENKASLMHRAIVYCVDISLDDSPAEIRLHSIRTVLRRVMYSRLEDVMECDCGLDAPACSDFVKACLPGGMTLSGSTCYCLHQTRCHAHGYCDGCDSMRPVGKCYSCGKTVTLA